MTETLTIGTDGEEVAASVAVVWAAGSVAVAGGDIVSTGSTCVASTAEVWDTRAATVLAMAVSESSAGTSVEPAVGRLHAKAPTMSVVAIIPSRF